MKAKLRYVFDRKKSANESLKEKPIELEIYFPDKTRLYYYTRISVEPKYWDTTRQLVSNKHGLANQYNQYLEFLKKEVTKAEIDAIENDNIFTRDMAKDLLYNRGNLDSFIEYAHACNSEDLKIGNIEFASWKRYNTIIRTFDKYCHQKLGRQCSFNDLNETFIKQLRSEERRVGKEC